MQVALALTPFPRLGNCIAVEPTTKAQVPFSPNASRICRCSFLCDNRETIPVVSFSNCDTKNYDHNYESTHAKAKILFEVPLPGLSSTAPAQLSQSWCKLSNTEDNGQKITKSILVVSLNQSLKFFSLQRETAQLQMELRWFVRIGSISTAEICMPHKVKVTKPPKEYTIYQKHPTKKIISASGTAATYHTVVAEKKEKSNPHLESRPRSQRNFLAVVICGQEGASILVYDPFKHKKKDNEGTDCTGRIILRQQLLPKRNFTMVQFSRCGCFVAAVSAAAHIFIWSVQIDNCSTEATKIPLELSISSRLQFHAKVRRTLRISSISFSPDSRYLALGCWTDAYQDKGKWSGSGLVYLFSQRNKIFVSKQNNIISPMRDHFNWVSSSVHIYDIPLHDKYDNDNHQSTWVCAGHISNGSTYNHIALAHHEMEWVEHQEKCSCEVKRSTNNTVNQHQKIDRNPNAIDGTERTTAMAKTAVGGIWMPSPTLVCWTFDSIHFVVGNGPFGVLATYRVPTAYSHTSGVTLELQPLNILSRSTRLTSLKISSNGVIAWAIGKGILFFPWSLLQPCVFKPNLLTPFPSQWRMTHHTTICNCNATFAETVAHKTVVQGTIQDSNVQTK